MSDNEDDIWDYKSFQKQKASDRVVDKVESKEPARKASGSQAKRGGNRRRSAPKRTKDTPTLPTAQPVPEPTVQGSQEDVPFTPKRRKAVKTPTPETPQTRNSGHCPSCQMPFSLLLVQTPRWHVSECLDAPSTAQTECPDGFCCSSALPSHYKRYSHFLLAQSRAVDQPSFSPPCAPDLPSPAADKSSVSNGFFPSPTKEKTKLNSPTSQSPSSSQESAAARRTSLEVWLSSPSKASQETSNQITADGGYPRLLQDPDVCSSAISYSPLISDQELFSDDEDEVAPHPSRSSTTNTPPCNTRYRTPRPDNGGSSSVRTTPGEDYWSECSTPVSDVSEQLHPEAAAALASEYTDNYQPLLSAINTQEDMASRRTPQPRVPTPQPRVLTPQPRVLTPQPRVSTPQPRVPTPQPRVPTPQPRVPTPQPRVPVPQPQRTVKAELPPSQTQESFTQGSQAVTSAPSSKTKKQMDIGVFFGLKPKVVKAAAEEKLQIKPQNPNTAASQSEKPPRKRKATGSLSGGTENGNEIPGTAATETQKRGGKRFRQNSSTEQAGRGRKQCPFYKKIPGTGFAVDAFQYGEIDSCSAYFLTHFHSDHYGGLTKKFRFPVYCSKITGNLVQNKLRVEKDFIHCLPMYTEVLVDGIKVVLLDANHCPGAVLLLFILPNGTTVLHTGDFRAEPSMERYPALLGRKVHTLYLDTTYCSPEYTFPPQQETVQFAVNAAFETVTLHPRTLVVCGTYSIGKEKVFLAIADVLGCKVCVSQDKYKTMQCLESAEIGALVTTDWHSSALHVLPMMQVNFKGLAAHLNKFSGKYDRVLAFKPTGWTYSDGCSSVAEIRPEIRGKITMYGIPYSEHSSFSEMKRFVQFIKPQKIIPTVNVGNWKSRAAMERYFADWLSGK